MRCEEGDGGNRRRRELPWLQPPPFSDQAIDVEPRKKERGYIGYTCV